MWPHGEPCTGYYEKWEELKVSQRWWQNSPEHRRFCGCCWEASGISSHKAAPLLVTPQSWPQAKWKRTRLQSPKGLPCSSNSKESACNAWDQGLILESGRSSGEGNGNPLQYSCLENSMDREASWVTVHGLQRVGHDWATNTHANHPKEGQTSGSIVLQVSRAQSPSKRPWWPWLTFPVSPFW